MLVGSGHQHMLTLAELRTFQGSHRHFRPSFSMYLGKFLVDWLSCPCYQLSGERQAVGTVVWNDGELDVRPLYTHCSTSGLCSHSHINFVIVLILVNTELGLAKFPELVSEHHG